MYACSRLVFGVRQAECTNLACHQLLPAGILRACSDGHTGKAKTSWLVQGYFYYIFGFCFVVGMLTVLITVEVAIVCTYVQLCAEDYLWWYASELCITPLSLLCMHACLHHHHSSPIFDGTGTGVPLGGSALSKA